MTRAKIAPKDRASKAKASKAKKVKKPITKKVAPSKKVASGAKLDVKAVTAPVENSKTSHKKQPVKPKRNAITRQGAKTLDLCLILDCTGSMASWIQRSKNTLREIIDHVKNEN